MPLFNQRLLFEAEDDDNAAQNPEDAGTNDAANPEDDAGDTNADDNADDNNNDDGGDDDFNIDTDDNAPDTDSGNDEGGDTSNPEDSGSSGGESAEDQVNVDNEDKQKDREIFDSLSPQEQKLKIVKLKQSYMDLYSRCDQIIEKYDAVGVEFENFGEVVKGSLNALYSLKEMISNYLLYLFDSKSYIENDITFNRFLTAMNQIKLITKSMRDSYKDEIEDAKANKPLNDKDIKDQK